MTESDIYLEQLREVVATLEHCLAGVPEGRLHERPGPHLNPIGWNYFHLLRVWDFDLNWICQGQPPEADAWHRGGFTERSGYDPDGKGASVTGVGFGYTDDEVDEIQMDVTVLQQYQATLLSEAEAFLCTAGEDELRRPTPNWTNPTILKSVAQRMRHTISHSYAHIGEMRYAKGVLGIPDNEHPIPTRQPRP